MGTSSNHTHASQKAAYVLGHQRPVSSLFNFLPRNVSFHDSFPFLPSPPVPDRTNTFDVSCSSHIRSIQARESFTQARRLLRVDHIPQPTILVDRQRYPPPSTRIIDTQKKRRSKTRVNTAVLIVAYCPAPLQGLRERGGCGTHGPGLQGKEYERNVSFLCNPTDHLQKKRAASGARRKLF